MKNRVLLLMLAMMLSIGASIAQNATKSVVYLKNGTSVTGVIMEMQNDTLKLKSADGSLSVYTMGEVDRIANVNALSEKKSGGSVRDFSNYKIRRLGRDICAGSRTLDPNQIYNILDKDLYDTYVSAYQQAGWGAFIITTGLISAGLGVYLGVLGKNQNIRNTGWVLCGVSGVVAPIGYVVRGMAKGRIGWVVEEYNSRQTASTFELAPTVLGFNDITTDSKSYAIGATIKISF